MAGVSILQDSFDLAIRRDRSKDKIGANAAWNLVDYIPNRKGAPIARRGGWEQKGTFSGSTPAYVRSGVFAPFNGGRHLLAVDSDGTVYRVTAEGETWTVDGTTRNVGALKQNPFFYFDDLFFPSPTGSATMSRANETTVAEYTYNTATYRPVYLTAHRNRLVGAVDEKIVFGPPGDPNQTWDDDAVYVQTQPIRGLATVRSAVLVFYDGHTDIMRGGIPAGYDVVEDDIRFDALFTNIGCISAFSICGWNEKVLWADRSGVYMTDGAAALDLCEVAGVRDLWRQTLAEHNADIYAGNIRVASGVFSDLLHVSITNISTHTHIDTFVFDIDKYQCWRYSNTPFTCYFENPFSPHQLYAGAEINQGKVAELSHTIDEDTGYDQDVEASPADGTAIEPVVEFPYHRFAHGFYRIVDLYLGYALEGEAYATVTINPTGADNSVAYTAVEPGPNGNDITITYTVSGNDTPLSVDVTGTAITVNVATDGGGSATSTAAQVITAVNDDAEAAALVTAAASGTVTGTVAAVSATNLAGAPALLVQFSVDPDPILPANGAYADYDDGDEYVLPVDIHGTEHEGYHWRRIPVRLEGAGVGVKVTQVDASTATRIYALGASVIQRQGWEQG